MTPVTAGSTIAVREMGWTPLNGNSRLVVPTTTGRPTATQTPARRRPVRNRAAASTSRNRPATGLASDASTLRQTIPAARRAGCRAA